jgi:hypothetical protein
MKVGDLVRCTHGTGTGTVGIIVALGPYGATTLATLSNGEFYSVVRLEVVSASG